MIVLAKFPENEQFSQTLSNLVLVLRGELDQFDCDILLRFYILCFNHCTEASFAEKFSKFILTFDLAPYF